MGIHLDFLNEYSNIYIYISLAAHIEKKTTMTRAIYIVFKNIFYFYIVYIYVETFLSAPFNWIDLG